jgi:hypothetical protein
MFEDAQHITDLMREETDAQGNKRLIAKRRFQQELETRNALVAMGFKRADARSALQRVRDAMEANTPHFFTNQGVVTDERQTPDHRTRLAAAKTIFGMLPGVNAPKEFTKVGPSEIQLEVHTIAPDGTRTAVRVTGG